MFLSLQKKFHHFLSSRSGKIKTYEDAFDTYIESSFIREKYQQENIDNIDNSSPRLKFERIRLCFHTIFMGRQLKKKKKLKQWT